MSVFLHREDFARTERQEFDVGIGTATVTMTMLALEPLKTPTGQMREAFSLIFKSGSPVVLPQGIYPMRNRNLLNAQSVDVFIVPIGRDPDGVRYQAVFN